MPRAELYVGELLMKLVSRQTGEISKVDYVPQKKAFSPFPFPDEEFLDRATPESEGVSSAFFAKLIRKLSDDRKSRIHRLMFLRHGKVIAECSFEPYDMEMWHVSYSMCKSITSMAIGLLISEKKLSLDDKLIDIFGARIGTFNIFKKPITVRNLLNMSSGVEFNEAGAVSGNDWRKSFFESPLKFDPGTKFEYNSMNSYMLSAIVTEITGKTLFEFCKERIFDPMGIKRVFWESCPQSITKGGWGLFMRAEDMAKLGQMYLDNGSYKGRQIIPRQWIVESTAWQIVTDSETDKHYGYQIWINDDRKGSYAFNGMMGQNVFVYPDVDMVIVTNAGNADIFQTSSMSITIRKWMKEKLVVSDEPLAENFTDFSELKAVCKSVSGRTAEFPVIVSGGWKDRSTRMSLGSARNKKVSYKGRKKGFKEAVHAYNIRNENQIVSNWLIKLNDKKYELEESGVGIFPLLMQVVHNNFTDGIRSIGFRYTEDRAFYIDVYEGESVFKLRCGFGDKRYISEINMHGENYKVSLKSICTRDEYNRLVIRNEIYFLEEAAMRILNIYFEDDPLDGKSSGTFIHPSVPMGIEVRLSENPGTEMLIDTIRNITPESTGLESAIISKLLKGGVKEVLEHAITGTMQPIMHGRLSNPDLVIREPI